MKRILSVDNMRTSDAATIAGGVEGRELMWRAGKAIYESVADIHGWTGTTGIICGSGNNAGDGYVLALLLAEAGFDCVVCLTGDRFSEDGRYYYEQCLDKGIKVVYIINSNEVDINELSNFSIIVDCLYGTGFHGCIKPPISHIVERINQLNDVYIISVDINSGLNGDNGLGEVCINSDLTISIGDYKPGHFLNMAKDVMKQHVNCPIGIEPVNKPYYLYEEEDAAELFPERKNMSNKGTYGYIALIGGSARYGGAIRLANMASAAMRCGVGVVSVATPSSLHNVIATQMLESTLFPLPDKDGELIYAPEALDELINHKRAVAFGMGIGRNNETARMLEHLLKNYEGTLIIDADGISDLADLGAELLLQTKAKVILTPHLGEMSRLTGHTILEIQAAPIETAFEFASQYGVTVLLKGPSTLVTDGKEVYITNKGCPGMATAGSGDVLSGIIAAIAGTHPDKPLLSAITGAWINGAAGELAMEEYGDVSMVASDTVGKIPAVLKRIRNN